MADFKDPTRPGEDLGEDQELFNGILGVLDCLNDRSLTKLKEKIVEVQLSREDEKVEAYAATATRRPGG